MATALPEELRKRLTCAVCMEQFREPKVLPCLHTYCNVCLEKLVKKQGSDLIITCPECREDVKIDDGDVGSLQSNFWVNNFMTLLSIQKGVTLTGKPLICEHCNSGDSAVSRCTNCKVVLCEYCVIAHKRIYAFLGHQILSLSEEKILESKALVKPAFCAKHADEELKLYCDTCQKTICRDCTIIDHRDHKYNFVADVAKRERKTVEAFLEETKAKDHVVEEGLKAVKAVESRFQSKIVKVSKDVDVFFDEQVKALEEMRGTLKHEVKTQGQAKLQALRSQEEMLALSLAKLRNSADFAEKALTDGNDVEILSIKQQLIKSLAQLNASQFYCKPFNNVYLKLKMNKGISDIGDMMSLALAPDTSKCVLGMVGGEHGVSYQTFAGQPVDFKLSIFGTAEKEPETGCMVLASVKRDQQDKSQDLSVRDNSDGSYFFSYLPETAGLCTLSVTVEGKNVHGSPFKWEVLPKLKSPDELKNILNRQRDNNKTKQCWKLKYLGSTRGNSQVEIGVTNCGRSGGCNHRNFWRCKNNVYTTCRAGYGSSQQASITSLQNNDILSVYLNQTAEKLRVVIYNHRNEQSESFFPFFNHYSIQSVLISPYEPSEGGGFTFAIR